MIDQIEDKLSKFELDTQKLFLKLRKLIFKCEPQVEEQMWAGLPSYYFGDCFIRLIPFANYVNIEASGIRKHIEELSGYKLTPKKMLKLSTGENIPWELMIKIFDETLHK
ncbi:MAG TPA: DUF1801 domain-containing protein [Bacilli bacterium]|nr:DUF1801 domain-containing protein [Bacilli bacterium]